jgi:hypothetical protein
MSSEIDTDTFSIEKVEKLFEQATVVKNNPVREVRKIQDLFIKFDNRASHGFSREFSAAKKLKQAGLPVVEHLFSGKSAKGNYLVTRAFADSIAVDEYLRSHVPDMSFFETITDLACSLLNAGFLHTDFHLGNLLYNPTENSFALVDVRKVRSIPVWLINTLPENSRLHVLKEFRGVLRKSQLIKLFIRAGINNPGEFYENMLSDDNKMIRNEWPRRRKQILSGYPKFTCKQDKYLINSLASEDEIANAVEISGGKAVFLAGFFLDLIQIPHRKVVKYDTHSDIAYAVPLPDQMPGGEAAIEMLTRLSSYDLMSAPADWRNNGKGLPMLATLSNVASESFISGGK